MSAATPDAIVTRQPARPDLGAGPIQTAGVSPSSPADELASPDVLVVGAGPGGLTAAASAAEAGLRVVLLDERGRPGGQYFKQPASRGWGAGPAPDGQFAAGATLIDRARAAGASLVSGAQVWGAFAPDDLGVVTRTGRHRVHPRALILAPGAYERAFPVPGWTLPGVMTTGAAQTLWRSYGTPPGRRVLISGNGPLNMQVAAELRRAGVTVVALAELARPAALARLPSLARMAAADRALVRDGLRYRGVLARGGVPVLYGAAVTALSGDGRVRRAIVSPIDPTSGEALPEGERVFDVDAVCLGFGFDPSNEIARVLGARHEPYDGRLETVVDDLGRTSLDRVWVVGDGARIGGARLAQAVGELVGLDVARRLGAEIGGSSSMKRESAARLTAKRHRRFQSALNAAFAAPRIDVQLATPDTLICRCEDVSCAAVERALADGPGHIGALKRATRAGMGPCQGRYCAPLITAMTSRQTGAGLNELSGFAPNPPAKPLRIGELLGPIASDESVSAAIRAARATLAGDPASSTDS